ncbi:hypothetical protein [Chryseobacterium gossypii]|uniref:hypothetical protein n=1 Tax=Chryseobacterium gossypii TaxID=3231602 RepID=UPI003525263B
MKCFGFLLFLYSLFNAQNIEFNRVDGHSANATIGNKSLKAFYRNKDFDLESENLIFKDLKVYPGKLNSPEIARYGVDKLIDSSGISYSFKIDKKNKKVTVFDENKNTVIEADLIFDPENPEVLKEINLVKNSNPSELLNAWITLATMNRLYGNKNNEFLKGLFKSAVFGATVGVINGVTTK